MVGRYKSVTISRFPHDEDHGTIEKCYSVSKILISCCNHVKGRAKLDVAEVRPTVTVIGI